MLEGCKYCQKIINNRGSLKAHEIRCKLNPERIKFNIDYSKKKKSNQYIKAKENGKEYIISNETRRKLSINNGMYNYRHTEDFKESQRKKAIERGLGGVTQSRWIKYKGKTLGSSYELEVVKSLDENNILWDIPKKFIYTDPFGKVRSYTPDIYLPEYNIYLDPKNDFLINNINPRLGFTDAEKIQRVMEQNSVRILILNKTQLSWSVIKMLL